MAIVDVDGLSINYTEQGTGDPLLLIPYLSADSACYAFQLEAFSARYRCVCIDLPGTGESDKPAGPYAVTGYADQVAAFLAAIDVPRAHVAGVSLGGAVGMQLAARHPDRVASLGLHSTWHAPDAYIRAGVQMWRGMAEHANTVADVVVTGIFPFCFTPEMYIERPDFVQGLAEFVHGRPAQPMEAFLAQTDAVLGHDAADVLGNIRTPTLITFGARDLLCPARFAEPMATAIPGAELMVFEHLSHAGLHEDPDTFNTTTLKFLARQQL